MENIKNEQTLWMEDSKLKDIPKHKLEFLQIMVFESKNLKQEEMLPFFMSVMKISKEKKISFTQQEMELILSVLKEHATQEDIQKINQIMQMKMCKIYLFRHFHPSFSFIPLFRKNVLFPRLFRVSFSYDG